MEDVTTGSCVLVSARGCLGLWQKQGVEFQDQGVAVRNGPFSVMEGSPSLPPSLYLSVCVHIS